MRFLALYLFYLLVPGWIVVRSLRLPAHGMPQVIAISYLFLWLVMVTGKAVSLDTGALAWLLNGSLLALAAGCGLTVYLRHREYLSAGGTFIAALRREPRRPLSAAHGITAAYTACAAVYALAAGPYVEIPADLWWHLGQIKSQLYLLQENGALSAPLYGAGFSKDNNYWYLLVACVAHLSGTGSAGLLAPLAWANSVLLLIAVYCFARLLFTRTDRTAVQTAIVAAFAGLFFLLHYGVSVFSFLRYYTLAPALLNYIVLLAALALVLRALHRERIDTATCILLPTYFLLMAAIHTQEALFAAIVTALMLALYSIRSIDWRATALRRLWQNRDTAAPGFRLLLLALLLAAALAYLTTHGYALLSLQRSPALNYNRLISIGELLPFLRNLYILDPTYQFYEVVTTWGLLVYVLLVAYWRDFRSNYYIMASMLAPVVTVFNPAFTDLALRFSTAEFLWRFCFIVPLPFVAAAVTVAMLQTLVRRGPPGPRTAAAIGLAMVVVLLFPLNGRFLESRYSRLYTLAPTPVANGPALWADLFAALEREPTGLLLTDPVTGYVATAMTRAQWAPGYKFIDRTFIGLTSKGYSAEDFARVAGWILVINQRDGAASRSGALSRHWPEGILAVSQRYSKEFVHFVESRPDIFEPRWSADRISVYRIRAGTRP